MTNLFVAGCESYTVAKCSFGCFCKANELQNANINQSVTTDVWAFSWSNQYWLLVITCLNVDIVLGG